MMSIFSGNSENGLTLRRLARLRLVSLLAIEQMLFLPVLSLNARAQPLTANQPNQIVTDGRTATAVTTTGNVTNVTTSTVSGPNAFNSFSQFGVGQGNTVNLYTPNGAQNLINIVRDAPAYVNGTLNSYANGKIGGNVYFADPYGFVVGKSGTVNVGSLNVSTPTKGFTDSIVGANGAINSGAVTNLINGSFPISPDGNIRILGRINAEDGVRLTGQNVVIGGAGMNDRERVNADHAVKFAASVNSKGLRSASAISVRNGSIHIGAVNSASISGRLSARSRSNTPSTITVEAGKNITLGKTASLNTSSKTGDAGNVTLKTQGDLTVASGAKINASSAKGNGGTVDLSADGKFAIGDKVQIDLSAPNGTKGKLILDPVDIVVGDASQGDANVNMSNATVAAAIAALNGTGTFTLTASNSITIDPHGRVDGGTAVNVTLSAPTLTVMAGGYLAGNTIALDSGVNGTININAATNGGARLVATTLQFTGGHLVLTSTATAIVGDDTASTSKNAAGFIGNNTISRYAAAMNGAGDLTVSAATSIVVDGSGKVDTRSIDAGSGLSTASSLDVILKAPAISIQLGGQVATKANNNSDSSFTTGDITLDATGAPGGTVSVSGLLAGGVTTLQAGSQVTLGGTGVIDTRITDSNGLATANSKNVVMTAPQVLAAQGSQILAGAVNADSSTTYIGGNVRLDASGSASGSVVAQGNIVGANVDLWAGQQVLVDTQARIGSSVPSGTAAITLQAPNIQVNQGAVFSAPAVNNGDPAAGATVNYALQSAFTVGDPTSNALVQGYVAALNGSGKMTLSSTVSLAVSSTGIVNAFNSDLILNAPSISLAGGSSVSAHSVSLMAGNVLNIDASRSNGAQISSPTQLHLATPTLNLTVGATDVVIGDPAADPTVNLSVATINSFLAAGPIQTLKITGASSITLDAQQSIDVRRQSGGVTNGTSANVILNAPTITIATGASIRTDVVNTVDGNNQPTTFYTAGDIALTSSNITAASGSLNGGVVTFNDGLSAIHVGPSGSGTGFISNATIASYLAALAGSSTFRLAASASISIDDGAVINGGSTRNLTFAAPTLTFAGNTTVSGNTVLLDSGRSGVINVNAASNSGAQITTQTLLQLTASQVNLTSGGAMFVGDASTSTNNGTAGFVSNATVARWVTAMHGIGTLQLSATSSITVDGTGIVDGTQMSNNVSSGNSVNLLLTASVITVAAAGKVTALAVNSGGTTYTSGTVTLNATGGGSNLVSISGTVKGSTVLLSANQISVFSGAVLSAGPSGTVIFSFNEDLTVNNSSDSNGVAGVLSNNVIASYVAAMSAGTFALSAGSHSLTLASTASITAGNGIAVGLSGATLNVVTGASINAVTVGFGFNGDNIVIAASDPGTSGYTFISNAQIAALILASSNATTLTISARSHITLAASGIIDTRFLNAQSHSTHNALGVELDAAIITVADGAQILAKAINSGGTTFTDGDVKLSASWSTSLISGLASSTTSITVDGTITGRNITIAANSSATSNMTSSAAGYFAVIGELLAGLGLNAGYVAGESYATVTINSQPTAHANISGSGNVAITATGSETASDPVIVIGAISPLGASAVVGSVKANVSVNVGVNATVAANGSLRVAAANDATLDISALTVTTAAQFVTTVAVGTADIQTQAIVSSGANISAGAGGISVSARNGNSFSTSATAFAYSPATGSGGVGAGMAYSNVSSVATAILGANVGSSGAATAGPVQVSAFSDTTKNAVSASVTMGQPSLLGKIVGGLAGLTTVSAELLGAMMKPLVSIEFPLKIAGTLSLANSNLTANAAITATDGGSAPAIYSSGDVSVVARLINDQIRNNSSSAVTVSNPSDPEAVTIAASVAYGSYTNNANAFVGQGVTINASRIAVSADTQLPNTNTWGQWNGLSETLSHLNANFGVVNNIITTYADATTSGASTAGVSGSFAYFGNTDNTTAWVASGATLTSTKPTTGSWSTQVVDGSQNGLTVNFASNITVSATATNNSINVGGVFGPLILLPGADSGGVAAGGSLNLIMSTSNTNAGVSNGATLSAKDIAVTAITTDMMFAVAPTSGSSSGSIALNGLTSLAFVNNETHASISSGATVTAPTINVEAYQNSSVLSLAGAIQLSTTSGVGIAVAYLTVNTDTAAYIGDNHSDVRISGDDAGATSADGGNITSSALTVFAATAGRLTVASVAVVESDPFAQLGAWTKTKNILAGSTGAFGITPTSMLTSALAKSNSKSPSFSIDIAGSSAVSQTGMDTTAFISGVTINQGNPYAASAAPFVQVEALSYTILDNGSGAAALNFAGSSKPSAAVDGTIAIGISQNSTTAFIANTTISDEARVDVSALTGGSETVVALGLTATRSGIAASIAASVALIADSTTAYIDNSNVTGVGAGTSNKLNVNAYQTSNIAIGGGSLYVSAATDDTSGSIGLALTYAQIRDPGGSKAVDAHITNSQVNGFDTLTVIGDDAAVIAAGAASAGFGGNGLAGAFVVDVISPTITAYITGSTITMSPGGTITVNAESIDSPDLDTALTTLVRSTNNGQLAHDNCTTSSGTQACVDFSGAALNGGVGSAPGAAITSIAGNIQAGKNNIGVSIVSDAISTTHSAYVAQSLLTTTGDVLVTAEDSAKIQSVAIGFGLATGKFAGQAGVVVSTIRNNVSAGIGDGNSTTTNTVVNANNVTVQSQDRSSIISTAAVGGASTQGSAAGLSIVYSEIDNQLNAGVTGAKIVAGSDAKVTATSNASISTVAVGVALSSRIGLAGSVATNVMGTNVTSSITGGADVMATNNVGVLANNTDGIAVFAGAFAISSGSAGGAG